MSERKAVVKNADMGEDMQQDAIECATQAMEKFNVEKDIAAYIKKEFDREIQPNLALHRGKKLWQLRHTRDQALHLLLSWSGCSVAVQVRLKLQLYNVYNSNMLI